LVLALALRERGISFDVYEHADGASSEADVVVGADGVHSVIRSHVVGDARGRFSGTVGYRGLVPVERMRSLPQDVKGGMRRIAAPRHCVRFLNRDYSARLRDPRHLRKDLLRILHVQQQRPRVHEVKRAVGQTSRGRVRLDELDRQAALLGEPPATGQIPPYALPGQDQPHVRPRRHAQRALAGPPARRNQRQSRRCRRRSRSGQTARPPHRHRPGPAPRGGESLPGRPRASTAPTR